MPTEARLRFRFAAVALVVALLAGASRADAYCRTTTCGLPAGFMPDPGQCYPPDYASWCASTGSQPLPVYWANACVSYDIQANASRQVPYATASRVIAEAFAKWTGAACGDGSGNESGAHPSISVSDLGPVACDQVQYNSDQGNQHVIIFHDDVWPYADASTTLALTTITFDPSTGEIFDADMEINSTPSHPLALADPVPDSGYDFQSIVQHEAGHFLGLAHSGEPNSTMLPRYTMGSTTMRTLSDDDEAGICAVYMPDGNRTVDASVAASGTVTAAACDPTPRNGFQSECAQPGNDVSGGNEVKCSLAEASPGFTSRHPARGFSTAIVAFALAAGARRRRRRASERDANVVPHAPDGLAATAPTARVWSRASRRDSR